MILSIIIPSYNEPTIMVLLDKIYSLMLPQGIGKEIILVDDGSNDQSIAQVEENSNKYTNLILIKHQINKGKGAAIKSGLSICHGDIVIIQDADLEYNPDDIIKVIEPIIKKETLVCYGSRHIDKSWRRKYFFMLKKHKGHSLIAFLGGRFITALFDLLFLIHLTDVLTCYKAFSAPLIKGLDLKYDGFEMEAEITAKILKKTKIREVSISYHPRTEEDGKKIKIRDGFKIIKVLILCFFYPSFSKPW